MDKILPGFPGLPSIEMTWGPWVQGSAFRVQSLIMPSKVLQGALMRLLQPINKQKPLGASPTARKDGAL